MDFTTDLAALASVCSKVSNVPVAPQPKVEVQPVPIRYLQGTNLSPVDTPRVSIDMASAMSRLNGSDRTQ